MVMAIMPAVKTGASAVARAMPTLADAAKRYAPASYNALQRLTGDKTPTVLAKSIASSGNGMQAQAFMMNAVRSGVPVNIVLGAVPLLGEQDKLMLQEHHSQYVQSARDAVDASQVNVEGSKLVSPDAEIVRMIESTCRELNVNSDALAELIVAFDVVRTRDIKQYQAFYDSVGQRRL